jgi:hypothetical protein
MHGYLWIIWVKLAGALWIIGEKIKQLINILFCGYRRLQIHDAAETYTRPGTVAPGNNKTTNDMSYFSIDFTMTNFQ